MDKNSFKYFIEYLAGVRKISKFKYKQGRLRYKEDQLAISRANHKQISQV